jgi:hypothetical protein
MWQALGLLIVLGIVTGCGGSSSAQACEDTADALASAAQRCGQDYQANYDAFVATGAGGDCANILSVRDEDGLYQECIPFLKSLSCEQLTSGNFTLPPSCVSQLMR